MKSEVYYFIFIGKMFLPPVCSSQNLLKVNAIHCFPLFHYSVFIKFPSKKRLANEWAKGRSGPDTHKAVGQWNTIHFYIDTPHYFLIPFEKNRLGLFYISCQQLIPSYRRQNLLVKESGCSMGISKDGNSLKKMEIKYL